LASRLEGANKIYVTRVLISEATNRLAADSVETREIDSVLVVGKAEPQRIYELLGRKGEALGSVRRLCRGARRLPAPGLGEGVHRFRGLPCHYSERSAEQSVPGKHSTVPCHPPCLDWSGVWSLAEK
jgi:adenylate cyclase